MDIDIKGSNSSKPHASNDQRVKGSAKSPLENEDQTKGSTSSPSDKVSLTNTAARLKELEKGLTNQPVVDSDRVRDVRGSINDGSFRIDPDHVADKLIDFESDLNTSS